MDIRFQVGGNRGIAPGTDPFVMLQSLLAEGRQFGVAEALDAIAHFGAPGEGLLFAFLCK